MELSTKNVGENLDDVLKDYSSLFDRRSDVSPSVKVKDEPDGIENERRREDEDIPLAKKIKKFRPKRSKEA
jgi:hypothetical protein